MTTSTEHTEKRSSPRFPCERPVRYTTMGVPGCPGSGHIMQGTILDLGNGGLGIQTEESGLEGGAVVQAWVPVAESPATVPVLAEVAWVNEARLGVHHAGLRFVL